MHLNKHLQSIQVEKERENKEEKRKQNRIYNSHGCLEKFISNNLSDLEYKYLSNHLRDLKLHLSHNLSTHTHVHINIHVPLEIS